MRILAAADIHGVISVYEWLPELVRQQDADLLILAGDLLECDSEDNQRRQARDIISLLKAISAPVLYVMGNDDFVPLDYEDEQIQQLHGRRLEWGGYSFVGYQYSLPFVGGIFEKPETEIEEDMRLLEPLLDPQTVFVSHSPVFGTLDSVGSALHVGSRSLAALLDRKPVLAHIHGHVHGCFGHKGNHFNVAGAGMRRAICVTVPSLTHDIVQQEP